jgi:hypothetical protein
VDQEVKAGPKLDALVAEKVMGWVDATDWGTPDWQGGDAYPSEFFPSEFFKVAHAIEGDSLKIDYVLCHHNLWRPSTSIADAWEVVEKLAADRVRPRNSEGQPANRFAIEIHPFGGTWWAGWTIEWSGGSDVLTGATADTAPLAICLAALKAVEG